MRISAETLADLQSLRIRARTLIDSVLTGKHRSLHKGFSIDFAEHRDYSPGDDIRFLDWQQFAKRDRFYVRQFEDESQLTVYLLIDVTDSMRYQSEETHWNKLEMAATLAAALAWLAVYQGDQSTVLACNMKSFDQFGPQYGMSGISALLDRLDALLETKNDSAEKGEQDAGLAGLLRSTEAIPQRSLVYLLTDAFGPSDELQRTLASLRFKQSEATLIQILDPAEQTFPFQGSTLFRGLEGGKLQVQAESIQKAYVKEFQQFLRETKQVAHQQQAKYHQFLTTTSPSDCLRRLLFQRSY